MRLNRFALTIFGLIMSLMLATSTTFAWFSMNATALIDQIELTVLSGDYDLLIALSNADGSEPEKEAFKARIETTELMLAIGENKKLKALTTNAEKTGLVENNLATASAATKNEYVELVFYFRSAAQYDIYLDLISLFQTGERAGEKMSSVLPTETNINPVSSWKGTGRNPSDYDALFEYYGKEQGEPLETRAAYASRVGFQSDEGSAMKIWNPYQGSALGFSNDAEEYNMAYNFLKFLDNELGVSIPTGNNYRAPAECIVSKDNYNNKENALLRLNKQVITPTEADQGNFYYGGKLIVSIWLEGNDGDCFTNIINDKMLINLSFKGHVFNANYDRPTNIE